MSTSNPSSSSISDGSGGSSGGGGGGGGGPCGACKFLRRKCVTGCIFAPYFDAEKGATHFAAVHKVFGASNVSKLLHHLPVDKRLDAVVTICYEAQARAREPVYGCVAHIFALQQEVAHLQAELSYFRAHLTTLELSTPPPPPLPLPHPTPPALSVSDLPSSSAVPSAYDLSSLFDPMLQSSWKLQTPQTNPRRFSATRTPAETPSFSAMVVAGGCDELARELLDRRAAPPTELSTESALLPPHAS